jgi:hypothetical protein
MVNVIKSKFNGANKEGDFAWMITQPHHARTLFIFNDNEGEFYDHFNGGSHTCGKGGGNAGIRPYQCKPHERATGIPTGTYDHGPHHMGYTSLDDHVKEVLPDAFTQLEALLKSGRFDSVAFSWDDETKLGGRIFETAQPVRDYIVENIIAIAARC